MSVATLARPAGKIFRHNDANGRLVAYQAGGVLIYPGRGEVQVPVVRQTAQKTAVLKTVPGIIIFSELPICNGWGDCDFCGQENNRPKVCKTDEGDRDVVICRKCGRRMRNRPSARF